MNKISIILLNCVLHYVLYEDCTIAQSSSDRTFAKRATLWWMWWRTIPINGPRSIL